MFEGIIIGGGLAGTQAAIQLGRYGDNVLVVDAGSGRSTTCRSYHNILGWPDGVSGLELRRLGREQAERTGIRFMQGEVIKASKKGDIFELKMKDGGTLQAYTLLLATGLSDRYPPIPGLAECLGSTLYVCPDCDGYEMKGKEGVVIGSGIPGANMALTISPWTDKLTYINHEKVGIEDRLLARLEEKGIIYVEQSVAQIEFVGNHDFRGALMEDGSMIRGECGFIAFGGNKIHSDLASMLGAERMENKHVVTDARTKETNVPGLWAAGDVGVHSEQAVIAMGEGLQSAIWMHKTIMQRKNNNL
ncbi:pyridine nucleotide-disulfide oxidoreductase [Paenibacillus swuensis]|uniref:Pyridine nucleotide-disulfide oxidoreductase n=1 Tax=Paenibacillus swuensis TaxID=1178515 RepID=A0A172TPY3_9BACL|nr:NAD(P)/FAD-dependent oxidoreductase [Paenibacillus swuensis]ANE49115.1 pyridine nucleotide-disulfide oxidoreductase [Paenibacillus swuensis]